MKYSSIIAIFFILVALDAAVTIVVARFDKTPPCNFQV
jgi:hypothetical protein